MKVEDIEKLMASFQASDSAGDTSCDKTVAMTAAKPAAAREGLQHAGEFWDDEAGYMRLPSKLKALPIDVELASEIGSFEINIKSVS